MHFRNYIHRPRVPISSQKPYARIEQENRDLRIQLEEALESRDDAMTALSGLQRLFANLEERNEMVKRHFFRVVDAAGIPRQHRAKGVAQCAEQAVKRIQSLQGEAGKLEATSSSTYFVEDEILGSLNNQRAKAIQFAEGHGLTNPTLQRLGNGVWLAEDADQTHVIHLEPTSQLSNPAGNATRQTAAHPGQTAAHSDTTPDCKTCLETEGNNERA